MAFVLRFLTLLFLSFCIAPSLSFAITLTVRNLNDSGPDSLRRAILESNATSGVDDEIVFEDGLAGKINLTSGQMFITDDVTIKGPPLDTNGMPRITIDAQSNSRIFTIDDASGAQIAVSISGLVFTNGSSNVEGGAILNMEELSIDSCVFQDNEANITGGVISNPAQATITSISNSKFTGNMAFQQGGVINNDGTINTITNSDFEMNTSQFGGAIINDGTITTINQCNFVMNEANFGGAAILNNTTLDTITQSTFTGNSAPNGNGGAVSNNGSIQLLSASTFNSNTTGLDGAGLYNQGMLGDILNSTFYGNTASGSGGALFNGDFAVMDVSFVTIANNSANSGGGIFADGQVRIINSIVGNNTSNDCAIGVAFSSEGGNFDTDNTCSGFTTVTSGGLNLDPSGLEQNGGPTDTIALCTGENTPTTGCLSNASAAIDAAQSCEDVEGNTISTDQRQFTRPFPSGSDCDSGAFESQPTGRITIAKSTNPTGLLGFEFTGTSFTDGCALEGTFFLNDSQSESCVLPLGEYTVTETVPDKFDLTISCVPDIGTTPPGVTIDLEDGEDITCTFLNTEKFILVIMLEGSGVGTVTSADGRIDCGGDCIEEYLSGSVVELTATPNVNSFFSGWIGNGGCTGLDPNITITMNEFTDCRARFTQDPLITVTKTGNGNGTITSLPPGIDCAPDCALESTEFPEGSLVELRAVPDQLSRFVEWTGTASDCNGDAQSVLVLADVSKTCTAQFALLPEITLVNGKQVNRGFL